MLLIGIILIGKNFIGSKPFKNLTVNEIKCVTVKLMPLNTETSLEEHEIEDLVDILHEVVIYNEDSSFGEYSGQSVIYTITKTDDTEIVINAYNPFIVINDNGYKTKYEPCEQLNSFGNKLGDTN